MRKRFRLFSTASLLTEIIHVGPFKILLLISPCLLAHRMYPGICEAKGKAVRRAAMQVTQATCKKGFWHLLPNTKLVATA